MQYDLECDVKKDVHPHLTVTLAGNVQKNSTFHTVVHL